MVFLESRIIKGNHIAKMPESKKSDRRNNLTNIKLKLILSHYVNTPENCY